MSNDPVRFAIVGTGAIASIHAQAIACIPTARLVAVHSRTYAKAEEFAKLYSAQVEPTLETLLQRPDIDAICVATPSGDHGSVAIPAFDAGKHVFCEKPLETTVEKIDQIIAASLRNHRLLGAVFQARFGQGAERLKAAVDSGRFGRLTLCCCRVKYWRDQTYYDSGGWRGTWASDGGGALMNQAIHGVDLLQWLLGIPKEVCAATETLAHERIETEDTATALLRFANGTLGVIEAATSTWPGFRRRIEISGDRGSAILEDDVLKYWQFADEEPEDEIIRAEADQPGKMVSGAGDPRAISFEGHRRQIEDFVSAIQSGKEPMIKGTDARHAVAVIRAIYESAASRQWVRIPS